MQKEIPVLLAREWKNVLLFMFRIQSAELIFRNKSDVVFFGNY